MSLLILPIIIVLAGVAVAVVKLFIRWEREDKEHLVPLVLLGLLVIEATIYVDQNTLPRGLFHPGSGSTQLRLPEIFITLALVARLLARGKPKRIGLPAGLWLAFAAWMAVGIAIGHLNHNGLAQDLYEAKDLFYIVGAYALAAGVPVRRYFDSGDLYKLGWLTVICASVIDLMTIAHIAINTNLPLLPLQDFGAVGAETAALCVAIGTMCFVPRLLTGPVRLRHVLALVPALVAVVLSTQRAVLVNVGVLVAVVVLVVALGHRANVVRRPHLRSGQVVLGLLAILAVAIAVVVVPAVADRHPVHIPLASNFQSLFHSQGKAESAQDRLNLAAEAERLIPQHPIIGWGLGVEFPYYEAGTRTVQQTAYAHDIALDLLLRLGLIGLGLFVLSFGGTFIGGLRVWRRHPDPMTAGFALALLGVVSGLIATGFLEPFLDEYRLATLFGVSIGMLRACHTSMIPRPRVVATLSRTIAPAEQRGDPKWT